MNTTRVKAHKVAAGMRVIILDDESGEWTVLSRHPKAGYWWVHRWTDNDEWQTNHAHYKHMEQVIS